MTRGDRVLDPVTGGRGIALLVTETWVAVSLDSEPCRAALLPRDGLRLEGDGADLAGLAQREAGR